MLVNVKNENFFSIDNLVSKNKWYLYNELNWRKILIGLKIFM